MFIDDEERLSDLYTTPRDRVVNDEPPQNEVYIEEDEVVLEMSKETKKEPSVRDSKTEVPLSPEEIAYKKKKRRFLLFIFLMLINISFFGYIIYLIVTNFMSLFGAN